MSEVKREPSWWVVKSERRGHPEWAHLERCGSGAEYTLGSRLGCESFVTHHGAMLIAGRLGGRVVPVYVTTRKVKRRTWRAERVVPKDHVTTLHDRKRVTRYVPAVERELVRTRWEVRSNRAPFPGVSGSVRTAVSELQAKELRDLARRLDERDVRVVRITTWRKR